MGLGIRHPAIASTASEINNAPTPCLTGLIFNYPIRPFEGVEQPTAQEPSIPEAEFRTTVDRRFSGVNVRIYLVASMIVAVLLGGLMLWSELANLKNGLANLIRAPIAKLGDPVGKNLSIGSRGSVLGEPRRHIGLR